MKESEKTPTPTCKINKGKRKISPEGHILEEEWLTVEGKNLEETEKAFDKRWGK